MRIVYSDFNNNGGGFPVYSESSDGFHQKIRTSFVFHTGDSKLSLTCVTGTLGGDSSNQVELSCNGKDAVITDPGTGSNSQQSCAIDLSSGFTDGREYEIDIKMSCPSDVLAMQQVVVEVL